ncbi:O-succinylbenzoic acid--CoA ligase [Arenibacter aquaticus]|uniref:O-succinylbenzoic acid--CoA ligase n=1 Tax=Arenibacter aquaticus TaxID=2489054 RepID=A0A3S0AC95_9FLAO|nr:AMP-binding protein [Arenibacter aquaticus]RTE52183.1 O-succinylbenzoic acid--CoA ligase [Arenibacter aquaticus]
MEPSFNQIHPNFKLNGVHYDVDGLKKLALDLVKEEELYKLTIGKFLMDWLDDTAILEVHTSGSTGAPKAIALKKVQMANSALATGKFFKMGAGTKAILCLSAQHIAGKMMLVRAMVLGWEIDVLEPTSNPLEKTNVGYDFGAMVPLQVAESIPRLNQIKTLIVGGAPISSGLKLQLLGVFTKVYETYGMTETITHIAVKEVGDNLHSNSFKVLPGISLSKDDRSCLVIEAPKISDHIIVTNDLVELLSPTEFQWLGRYDNVINSAGIKLIPEQIESKLSKIINCKFFVTGITDVKLGQKLILVVEGEVDTKKLLHDIKANPNLSKYEVPKDIFSLPQFIYTKNGKLNRKETMRVLKLE